MKAGRGQIGVSAWRVGRFRRGVFYYASALIAGAPAAQLTNQQVQNICKIFQTIEGKLLALDAPPC